MLLSPSGEFLEDCGGIGGCGKIMEGLGVSSGAFT
jgi:hypothetical protein